MNWYKIFEGTTLKCIVLADDADDALFHKVRKIFPKANGTQMLRPENDHDMDTARREMTDSNK
jgi:hypothetical protein